MSSFTTLFPSEWNSVEEFVTQLNWNYSGGEELGNTTTVNNGTSSDVRDENLALIEMAILAMIFVLIVFGNGVVLLALSMRHRAMTRMYYFLLHLCISDLLTGFFNVLPQLAWEITHRFVGGNFLCKGVKYLQILGP